MQLLKASPSAPLPACVATIGFFDGVHLGHQYLIRQVREIAAGKGYASMAITFPVHPRKVLHPAYQPELLTTPEEKTDRIGATGIAYCAMIDFTPALSELSAGEFMQKVLKDTFNVKTLLIGYDHRFGKNRTDTFEAYVRYGEKLQMEVIRAEECRIGDNCVSSSVIRSLLHDGKTGAANRLLAYPYFIRGTVTNGYRIGRTIGYPTANIKVNHPEKLIPARGVYAVKVTLQGATYNGMLNIGHRPTLNNGSDKSIEVHILDFKGNIYNEPLQVEFVSYIRKEIRFGTLEELVSQLHRDEANIRQLFHTL